MLRRSLFLLAVLALAIASVDLLAQGCAMCKAVAESEQTFGGAQSVGRGLNNGILYLMAVPYLLLFLLFRKRIVGFVKELSGAQG
ncbi:MAG: hypothetical protein M3R08_06280 [Bacteroidota bacterium]|nr:hypothetical protein [Bacteroidota bacterium]